MVGFGIRQKKEGIFKNDRNELMGRKMAEFSGGCIEKKVKNENGRQQSLPWNSGIIKTCFFCIFQGFHIF